MAQTQSEYRKVFQAIRDRIIGGGLAAGQKLPPERTLCREFDVSRITLRHALRLLEDIGLVERFQGIGTFVKNIKPRKIAIRNCDFSGSIRMSAPETDRELLTWTHMPVPAAVAEYLGLDSGQEIIFFERLDRSGGDPIAYDMGYVLSHLKDTLDRTILTRIDFFDLWLKRLDWKVIHGTEYTEAIAADMQAAQRLNIPLDAPVLKVTDVNSGERGPFALFESYYNAQQVKLISTSKRNVSNV